MGHGGGGVSAGLECAGRRVAGGNLAEQVTPAGDPGGAPAGRWQDQGERPGLADRARGKGRTPAQPPPWASGLLVGRGGTGRGWGGTARIP